MHRQEPPVGGTGDAFQRMAIKLGMSRSAEFRRRRPERGTAEQHIKQGKNAILWTRRSCRKFQNNAVRLQLHALAYDLANFSRTLALPEAVKQWSLASLRE